MVTEKTFTIEKSSKNGRYSYQTGTLSELIKSYSYTLECGEAYQKEKGNKKIDRNPKTIKSLVKNLNNALDNSAQDGCSIEYYRVMLEGELKKS